MQEHFPQAFLLWGLAALSMAWVLPSVFQGMLAVALLFTWGISEIAGFAQWHWQSAALIALTLFPLAWLQRSPTLLGSALIAVLGLLTAILLSSRIDEWVFFFLPVAAVILLVIAKALQRFAFAGANALPEKLGVLIYGLYLLILSFAMNSSVSRGFYKVAGSTPELVLTGLLIAACLLAGFVTAIISYQRLTQNTPGSHLHTTDWLHWMILTLITSLTLFAVQYSDHNTLFWLSVAANVALALHAVLLIVQGTQMQQRGRVVLGGLLLVTLAALRFNDLFDSLLMRALVFVLFGAGLFYVGHRLNRHPADGAVPIPATDSSESQQ